MIISRKNYDKAIDKAFKQGFSASQDEFNCYIKSGYVYVVINRYSGLYEGHTKFIKSFNTQKEAYTYIENVDYDDAYEYEMIRISVNAGETSE